VSKSSIDGGSGAAAASVTLSSANGTLALNSSSVNAPHRRQRGRGITSPTARCPPARRRCWCATPGCTATWRRPGISLSSAGDIVLTGSRSTAARSDLSGNNIQLNGGSQLTGSNVSLTAAGSPAAPAPLRASRRRAVAKANLINLSDVGLAIGTAKQLRQRSGADQHLQQTTPGLLPTSSGRMPHSPPGWVTLGSISLAGGYLFVQAPTLLLPSPTGPGNIFIDYLPTDPTAALTLSLVSPPTGITTLVFGGTPETGSIFIGNGTQTFALQSNTNLVFDTSARLSTRTRSAATARCWARRRHRAGVVDHIASYN